MKNKQLNREEEVLRDKLNELDFDFQPADWNALEKQLPSSGGASSWLSGKALIGAAVVVSLTVAWFMIDPTAEQSAIAEDAKGSVEVPKEVVVQSSNSEESNIQSNEANKGTEELSVDKEVAEEADLAELSASDASNNEEIALAEKETKKDQEIEAVPLQEQESSISKEEESIAETPVTEEINTDEKVDQNESAFVINGIQSPEKVCKGQIFKARLNLKGSLPDGYTIAWYADDQLMIDGEYLETSIRENGLSRITAEVKDEKGEVVGSYENSLQTVDLPEIDFSYEDLQDPYYDFNAKVLVKDDLYHSYQWIDENGDVIAEGSNPTIAFKRKGIYDLELKAKTEEGCYTKIAKPIAIEEDFDPLAPNAFTPLNGDGVNETFMPKAFTIRDDRFNMRIMSIDGNLIYESNDVKDHWNGKMNNSGQMMPAGQYLWQITITNQEGMSRTFIGNIRILSD